jgi:hypothetical protein
MSWRAALMFLDSEVVWCFACCAGIKAIKLYGWEEPYKARIEKIRDEEMKEEWWVMLLAARIVGHARLRRLIQSVRAMHCPWTTIGPNVGHT